MSQYCPSADGSCVTACATPPSIAAAISAGRSRLTAGMVSALRLTAVMRLTRRVRARHVAPVGRFASFVLLAFWSGCGPNLPPTVAPPQPDPTFDPLRASLQAYIDKTQPYRKQAAQAQESTPGKASPTPAAAEALRTR